MLCESDSSVALSSTPNRAFEIKPEPWGSLVGASLSLAVRAGFGEGAFDVGAVVVAVPFSFSFSFSLSLSFLAFAAVDWGAAASG